MKKTELKLLSELLKNSRRSDRELAKAVGVSQPTVSRMIKKLEKEGVIKEYTIIPDFTKLGYHLMSLVFARFNSTLSEKTLETAIKTAKERLAEIPESVMLERGMGLGFNGVVLSFHKNYTACAELTQRLSQFPFLGPYEIQHFLVNLDDKVHYRPLTMSTLSDHLLEADIEKAENTS